MPTTACASTTRQPAAAAQQARIRQAASPAAPWRPAGLSGQPLPRGAPAAAARRPQRRGVAPVASLLSGLGAVFKNDPAERTRKQYQERVDAISALEPSMQQLSDGQLRELTAALQGRARSGEALDSLLVEAFAVRGRGAGCVCVRAVWWQRGCGPLVVGRWGNVLRRAMPAERLLDTQRAIGLWTGSAIGTLRQEARLLCHPLAHRSPPLTAALFPRPLQLVREASRRVLGLRPFDVQLIGGMILHEGQIAEMRTGEGKTLVAVLPAFLNALAGGWRGGGVEGLAGLGGRRGGAACGVC